MSFRTEFMAELLIHLDFHHHEMGEPTMEAFFSVLKGENRDLVMEAMRRLRTAEWMPKPYDVLAELATMRTERHRAQSFVYSVYRLEAGGKPEKLSARTGTHTEEALLGPRGEVATGTFGHTNTLFLPGQPRNRRLFVRDASGKVVAMLDRREGEDIRWAHKP